MRLQENPSSLILQDRESWAVSTGHPGLPGLAPAPAPNTNVARTAVLLMTKA